MELFSKPKDGWVDINIKGYEYVIGASYLTDVPMDFLNAIIAHFKYGTPISVYVDEEGSEDIICLTENLLVISLLQETKVVSCKAINVDNAAFIREVLSGIEEYFDSWVNWFLDDDEEMMKNRTIELKRKLDEAKILEESNHIKTYDKSLEVGTNFG